MKCPICEREYNGEYCEHCNQKSKIFDFEDETPSEPVDFSIYQRQEDLSTPDDTVSKVFNFDDEDNIEPITDYNPYQTETEEDTDDKEEDEAKPQTKKIIITICMVSTLLVLLTIFCVLKLIDKTENENQETTVPTTVAETTFFDTNVTPATSDEIYYSDQYDASYLDDGYYSEEYETYLKEYKKLEDGHFNPEYGYFHKDSGFYYRQTGNGVKITGFEKYYDIDNLPTEITIEIPSEINGLPVTDIDYTSGMYCLDSYIRYYYQKNKLYTTSSNSEVYDQNECIYVKVIVPYSVKRIRQGAFTYTTEIDEIVIEDGVESIEENAFSECYSLKKITIPPSVTYMAECMAGVKYDDMSFYSDTKKVIEGFTIYGDYGSTAQEYADTYGITFSQR